MSVFNLDNEKMNKYVISHLITGNWIKQWMISTSSPSFFFWARMVTSSPLGRSRRNSTASSRMMFAKSTLLTYGENVRRIVPRSLIYQQESENNENTAATENSQKHGKHKVSVPYRESHCSLFSKRIQSVGDVHRKAILAAGQENSPYHWGNHQESKSILVQARFKSIYTASKAELGNRAPIKLRLPSHNP